MNAGHNPFNLLTCTPILGLTAENDLPKLKW